MEKLFKFLEEKRNFLEILELGFSNQQKYQQKEKSTHQGIFQRGTQGV